MATHAPEFLSKHLQERDVKSDASADIASKGFTSHQPAGSFVANWRGLIAMPTHATGFLDKNLQEGNAALAIDNARVCSSYRSQVDMLHVFRTIVIHDLATGPVHSLHPEELAFLHLPYRWNLRVPSVV